MELDYKIMLGVITILIVIYSYYDYIKDIFKGVTKPHLFSWIVFVTLDVISVLVQFHAGAGPGVWSTAGVMCGAIIVMLLSFKYGEKDIKKSDLISLILALITIILYVSVSDPTYSMIFVLIILTFGFYPTFRKSWNKPEEETISMYVLAGIRSAIAIFATIQISFLTISLPLYVVLINIVFVSLVIVRKKQLGLK